MSNVYVVDTSSLIDLELNYPIVLFPTVWKNLGSLIDEDRLISVHEVFEEIEKSNTSLHSWCQKNKTVFQKRNYDIINTVKQIMKKHPKLVNVDRTKDSADPFIIAYAYVRLQSLDNNKTIIVTQEKDKPNKIPFVAKDYSIDCMNLLGFFKNEKWEF